MPSYVVPDTNFLIHGRSLDEIAGDLENPTWVLVRTVIKEIDEKTHHENARIKRRARKAQQRIESTIDGDNRGTTVAFMPKTAPDYVALDLDATDIDDRVIGDIIAFKEQHPATDVHLLTLDSGMRIRARHHGIAMIGDAERFRASADEDEVEARARRAEDEIRRRDRAEPRITASLAAGTDQLTIAPALRDEVVADIVREFAAPEEAITSQMMRALSMTLHREQSDYQDLLRNYADNLSAYLRDMWTFLYGKHALAIELRNEGDVPAENLEFTLFPPLNGEFITELSTRPDVPKKPARFTIAYPNALVGFDAMRSGAISISPFIQRRPDTPPIEMQSIYGRKFVAWRKTFRQRDRWELDTLLIDLPTPLPEALALKFEVRMDNKLGMSTGQLVLKTIEIPLSQCCADICADLRQVP